MSDSLSLNLQLSAGTPVQEPASVPALHLQASEEDTPTDFPVLSLSAYQSVQSGLAFPLAFPLAFGWQAPDGCATEAYLALSLQPSATPQQLYIVETDPFWHAEKGFYYTKHELLTPGLSQVHWDNLIGVPAFSITETDPVFQQSAASGISALMIQNWNTAVTWGNHALAGYLTQNQAITLSGEASGTGSAGINVTLSNNAVISKVLTGYALKPAAAISASDSILTAFGKLEARVNTWSPGTWEPPISAGQITEYWRGDKTWQTLNTGVVPEGTRLYFTSSRVLGTVLNGYAGGFNQPISGTMTVLQALSNLQAQVSTKVPVGRVLSINGTAYDLSQDRAWTISVPTVDLSQYYTKTESDGRFAPITGSGNYIQNQNSAAQTGANFWISGSGRVASLTTDDLYGGVILTIHHDNIVANNFYGSRIQANSEFIVRNTYNSITSPVDGYLKYYAFNGHTFSTNAGDKVSIGGTYTLDVNGTGRFSSSVNVGNFSIVPGTASPDTANLLIGDGTGWRINFKTYGGTQVGFISDVGSADFASTVSAANFTTGIYPRYNSTLYYGVIDGPNGMAGNFTHQYHGSWLKLLTADYAIDAGGSGRFSGDLLITPSYASSANLVLGASGSGNAIGLARRANTNNFALDSNTVANIITANGQTGNVSIGHGNDNGYKLDVNGSGRFSGSLQLQNGVLYMETSSHIYWRDTTNYATYSRIGYNGSNNRLEVWKYNGGLIQFRDNAQTVMYLDFDNSNVYMLAPQATVDPDKIMVLDNNIVKYMTKAQLGIGATISQPANQIVYGTGSGVGSDVGLKYFNDTNLAAQVRLGWATFGQTYSASNAVIARNLAFITNNSTYSLINTGDTGAFIDVGSYGIVFGVNKTTSSTTYNSSDMRLTSDGKLLVGYTSSQGDYAGQFNGNMLVNGNLRVTYLGGWLRADTYGNVSGVQYFDLNNFTLRLNQACIPFGYNDVYGTMTTSNSFLYDGSHLIVGYTASQGAYALQVNGKILAYDGMTIPTATTSGIGKLAFTYGSDDYGKITVDSGAGNMLIAPPSYGGLVIMSMGDTVPTAKFNHGYITINGAAAVHNLDVAGTVGDSRGFGRYSIGVTGAPAYSFYGDTDTGFGWATYDTLTLTTAGSERARVTPDGNLLLGTATTYNPYRWDRLFQIDGATNARIDISTGALRGSMNVIQAGYYGASNPSFSVGAESNHDLLFYTNRVARSIITNDGKFLIGYTASQGAYQLQVNGNTYVSGGLALNNGSYTISPSGSHVVISNNADTFFYSPARNDFYGVIRGESGRWLIGNGNTVYDDGVNKLQVIGTARIADTTLIGYTTSQGSYKLQVNGSGYYAGSVVAQNASTSTTGSQAGYFENVITWGASPSFVSGPSHSANINYLNYKFGGNATLPNSATFTALNSTLRLTATASAVITCGQAAGIRAISANAVMVQIDPMGAGNTGSYSHVAGMQIFGPYPVGGGGATNLPTISNYYGLLIGDQGEYTNLSATITNRYAIYQVGSADINQFAGVIKTSNDVDITNNTKGLILTDTTNGNRYRVQSTNGVLTLQQL